MTAMIAILLDKTSEYGDRLDSAGYLGEYDESDVERALFVIASDPAEDEDLIEDCSQSLARIWLRRGTVNEDLLSWLPNGARAFAQLVLDSA